MDKGKGISGQSGLTPADEREIADVMIRYATAIDRRDWQLLETCFTPDFQGDYGEDKQWSNSEQIVRHMIDVHKQFGPTLHRITNIVAHTAPQGAIACSYVDALLMEKEPGGPKRQVAGLYEDELVRQASGWRISRRRFSLVRLVTDGIAG